MKFKIYISKTTTIRLLSVIFLILLNFKDLLAQDTLDHKIVFSDGISIESGLGYFAVRDEYFSREKYSGTLPYYSIYWSRFHDKNGFCLKLKYRSSLDINNYNISTSITQFSLNADFIYPIGKFTIFSKEVFSYLGPSAEFYIFSNEQNFVENGISLNISIAMLISLGINSEFIVPISKSFQLSSSFHLSLLSLGLRMPELIEPYDNDKEKESFFKLLTPFSGINFNTSLGVRYFWHKSISTKLAYNFEILSINEWDTLLAVSENIIFTFTYHF